MLTRQSTNACSNPLAPASRSGDPAEDLNRSTSHGASLCTDLSDYTPTTPVAYDATGTNLTTSLGLVNNGGNPTAYLEPRSRSGSPTSPLQGSRRAHLGDLFANRGGETLLRMIELLQPVSRASLPALANLSELPTALVGASVGQLEGHGLVAVEERVDHRGRLLWVRLTEEGRQALPELAGGGRNADV